MKHKQFTNFDAFANAVRDVDSNMMLQNPEYYSWSIAQVNLSGINVQVGMEGSGNITEGTSRSDGYITSFRSITITLALTLRTEKLWPKIQRRFWNRDVTFVSAGLKHDWCSIFIPDHKLVVGGTFVEPSSDEKTTCRVTSLNSQLAKQFRNIVQLIMTTAANCQEFESSPASTCAQQNC